MKKNLLIILYLCNRIHGYTVYTGPAGSTLPILGSGVGSVLLNNPTGSNNVYFNDILKVSLTGYT